MTDLIVWLLVVGGVVYLVAVRLVVIPENQRVAVMSLGQCAGLRGPGILFKWSAGETRWVRVSVGDRGEIVAPGLGRVHGSDVPVEVVGPVRVGEAVRVSGFGAGKVLVVRDADQAKTVTCERCGHIMVLR